MELISTIATFIMLGACIGGFVFVLSYAMFFRWWKTGAGRALLAFVTSLVLVFISNLLAIFLGTEYWGREWVRLIIYSAVFASTWTLVWTLWHSWRKNYPQEPGAK